jgi:hypothetical protein
MKTQELSVIFEEKRSASPRGVDCIFVPINEKWALKMFSSDYVRDKSHRLQKELSEHNLAPKVGGQINLDRDGSNYYCYGFVTEIVETVLSHEYIVGLDKGQEDWGLFRETKEEMKDQVAELKDEYESLGYSPYDLHPGNLGYNKDGRLICIDFGHWD